MGDVSHTRIVAVSVQQPHQKISIYLQPVLSTGKCTVLATAVREQVVELQFAAGRSPAVAAAAWDRYHAAEFCITFHKQISAHNPSSLPLQQRKSLEYYF